MAYNSACTVGKISYRPELPKWPKKKNSCSKMWLIDQLYIKLGLQDCDSCPISKLGPAHEFNGFGKLKCYCEFECHQLDSFNHKLELAISNTFLLQFLLDLRAWLTPQESKELKRKQKLLYNLITL